MITTGSEPNWPIDKIEKNGVSLLIIGLVLPMSAIMLGAIMVFFRWADLDWTLDIVVMAILFVLLSCLMASFILPGVLKGSKVREWQAGFQPDSEPEEYATRIISACMSSKIIQLAVLDGAANACFACLLAVPSYYLLVGGVLATLTMLVSIPFPGWLGSQFKDYWSALTGRAVI